MGIPTGSIPGARSNTQQSQPDCGARGELMDCAKCGDPMKYRAADFDVYEIGDRFEVDRYPAHWQCLQCGHTEPIEESE